MPERLRGRTANPLGFALVGSNPIVCVFFFRSMPPAFRIKKTKEALLRRLDELVRRDEAAFRAELLTMQEKYIAKAVTSRDMRIYEGVHLRLQTGFYDGKIVPEPPVGGLYYDRGVYWSPSTGATYMLVGTTWKVCRPS